MSKEAWLILLILVLLTMYFSGRKPKKVFEFKQPVQEIIIPHNYGRINK